MSCQITYKNGVAKVVNENGTPSKLYADALALTKNQETALNVWATAYTPTFETVVGKTAKNDAVELKEVLHFLRNRNAQTESLSESEKFQLVQFMKVNGFENLSELSTRLNKIFRNGNFVGINSTEAYKYDLYTPDELKNINLKEMERLLVKIDGQLLKGDIEVVPQEPVNKYRNTDYLTILGTSEIIPQEVIDKDIENLIQDFNSETEFRAKIQELPYSSFVRDFYENEAFAKSVMDRFKGLKRTPVLDIVNGDLSNLKTNTFTTVKNTIQRGINKNKIQAEAEYLESIPLVVWMNSAKEIRGILREIEEEFVDYNIDLVGLENSYKDRQAVIDLLNSLTTLVINPSQENILDFSQKHDALIPKKNYSEVQKLPENYAGLNIVKLYSEKSPAELYEKYALLKVGENLYHKVTRLTDTTDAYEYLYQEVIEDRLSIPKDVLIVEDFKDPINKPQVLEGISRFVNSRSTGIESPLQEEISLYQLVFNHAPLPTVNSRKNIEDIPQIKTNVEYLKTDFVSDFYNYTLVEKAKDSIAYRNVLSKFQINDKDITLVDPLETIEGIDYGQELRDYMRLKKDSNMQHLFENENEGLEQEVYLINNTDRIPNYSGTSSMDRQHLITSPNNGDWLKARGKFWRKVKEGKYVDIYAIANIPASELYYNVSVDVPLNNEVIDNLLKVYDTPRENIVKPYVFPTIVQKIREKSNFIKSKVFEKNLVGFLRNKGIEVVTEENAVRRALEQSGIQGVNGMFDIANDLGVKETLTIKINNNIISVTPNPRSSQVNTREKAVSVNYGIYNKVVSKLKEKTGNLFRPAFVTKTDTTIVLNLPQDLEQKVNNLQETYSEIQEILSQEKQRQQEADFENARRAEEKRGVSRASLNDLGYSFLQTPAGNVLGFEKDGVIYLDDKQLNDTTTLHEAIHVWASLLKIKAERGDVKAQQIFEKRKELFSDIASEWDKFHEGVEGVGDMNAAIISKKGAEELDRQQEVSFRVDNLIIAQELEKTDKIPQEIKLLTGWEKVNNEWVYEIPDIELKEDLAVELGKEYSVEEIVKDSELLQAYPELKNAKIIFNNAGRNNYDGNRGHIELDTRGNLEGGNGGGYQLAGGSDTIFAQGATNVRLYAIRRANVTSNLSHELVHFAQWTEGLYVGGSPGIADIRIRKITGIEETDTVGVSRDKIQKALLREGITQSDKNLLKSGEQYYSGLDSKALIKAYESFAGEVMARNIQRRLSLTQEQKKQILLTSTEDVSEKDKIFLTKEDVQGLQQNLSKKIGLDLSSPAYARRPNETRDAYFERLIDEVEAYITAPEMAKQLEELRKESPSLWEKIIDYINQLNAWLKDQIGLTEYEGNILDMTQQEYIAALGVSVLKDDYTSSFEDDRVLISIATTIADINLKFVSLPTEKEQEDFYNKMDNCG